MIYEYVYAHAYACIMHANMLCTQENMHRYACMIMSVKNAYIYIITESRQGDVFIINFY